jgi:hypothetical protein
MAALTGSKRHGESLRFVAFDLLYLAGVDLRSLPWRARRERLELLAQAFEPPTSRSWFNPARQLTRGVGPALLQVRPDSSRPREARRREGDVTKDHIRLRPTVLGR